VRAGAGRVPRQEVMCAAEGVGEREGGGSSQLIGWHELIKVCCVCG